MRYKCIVSYDGTLYHGFQSQTTGVTIQEKIEEVLLIINKKKVNVFASGRTDAGVHAISQVFHFDSDIDMGEWNMKNAINTRLPKDIYIKEVQKVDDSFHSRYSAKSKIYHYIIDFNEFNPLYKNYRFYPSYKNISIEKMIEASKVFIGVHDFKSFTKNHKTENTIREIYSIDFVLENNVLTIKFHGNGFLHNMVRILVAMLIEVGINKYSKENLKTILDEKNRVYAPKTAPACGLYLYEVLY